MAHPTLQGEISGRRSCVCNGHMSSDHASFRRPAMNVAYITMAFPSPRETFASNDVAALRARGISIAVHSLRPQADGTHSLAKERGVSDVPMTYATPSRIVHGLAMAVVRPRLALSLIRDVVATCWQRPMHSAKSLLLLPRVLNCFSDLERNPPDVVHVYWGHYPSLVGRLVQCHLPSITVTISLAAYDLEMGYGITAFVARDASAVRTLAEVNVPQIVSSYGVPEEKVVVIPDGVDLDRMSAAPHDMKVPKRIATAGNMSRRKGMFDVIDVFQQIHERHPEASLVMMGDGPERKNLEERSSSLGLNGSVEFLGHVSHDRVFEEMSKAEVFLFMSTSRGERLPNVVKEAMLCGCVCIVTNTAGIQELIPDDQHGFVVPLEGIQEAVKRIDAIFENPRNVAAIAQEGRERIARCFSLDASVSAYIRLWELVSGGHPLTDPYEHQVRI